MKQILRGVFLFSILSLSVLLVACQDEEPKTEFNVIFLDYDGNTISTQIVLLGEDAVEPKAPLIKGYQFVRWNQVFTNVERDLTIRPIYEANPYTISFNSQGGKELEDYSTFYDDEITNLPKPTREGYRFLGWYYQGEPIQLPFLYQYDENIRLDAKWEVGEEIYTITFQTHSELPLESLEVTRNDIISLTKPSRPGYLFSGWYYEDELVSVPFEFTFDHDITLEARWVELGSISYTITYQLFDDIVETNQVTAGETVSLLAPERSGYHFLGWYYLDMQVTEPFEFNYTHDITLVAKWEELTTYSIYLIDQDVSETILVMFGETIFLPAPDREHHFFLGWYDGDELINNSFVYHYDHDLTLEAKWEEEENFQLSFYTNGGTSIESMKVYSGNTIYDLPIPSRNQDEFLGWYYNDKQIQIPFIYDFGKDITLEAKWLIRYHITFNTNGADPIETKWITPNQMIINLPLPTRQGHHFLGWFYDDDRIELPFSYTFDDNITLVAKWVERNEDFDYFISNNEVTITGYNADAPHVVIPTHIENHPVTSIGYQAFKDNTLIKTVQFPENSQLTTIYGSAFMGALNLESINLPNRVTTIGGNAFSDTPKLVSIHIPQGVERIQMNTFENSGIHHITFTEDSQLTIIDRLAFAGATNLSSIEVPSSVERIYDHAFYGANGLERMTLPFIGESLTGSRADFGYIFGKTHYPGSYNANGYYLPNSLQEVVFTGGTLVYYNAFSGASSLRKIVIPDSVKSIHPAFNGTSNLESITLPFIGRSEDNTTNNGFGYIFGNNSYPNSYNAGGFHIPAGLKEVNITGGQSIPAYAFYQVSSLKQLGMPSSVTVIGDFAFYGTSISSIEIPRTVTHIGTYAFSENPNLLTVSFQTNSQLTVMDYAFNGATGLTQIEIPKRVISLDGTFQHAKNLTLLTFETGSQLEHVGYMSFGNTLNLLTLELPKTVKTIGDYAFYKSGLNSFQIEKDSQLEHVGYMSFGNTSNLLTLELPKTVKTIGDYAFYKSGLNSFQIEEDSQLEQIGHYAFKDTVQLASFIIPNKVQMIGNQAFYNSGLKTLYFTPDSQLEEIGSSAFQETNHLSGVTIPSSITHIGTSAFENSAINEIHFASASQLEEIGASTFKGTSNLTSITLPDSLLTIGDYAFMETSFTSLIIPNNVIVIGEGAFSGMRYLENLTIPFVGGMDTHYNKESQFGYLFGLEQYLDSYDAGGYYLPLSLKEVVITGGTQIASSAFSGASQIESLSIPKSVKTIGAYAFYGMTNLKEVHIEDNSELKSIGYAAFSHANQIEKLVILDSVTSIDDYAFSNMANLTTLQFEADSQLTTIGRFAFSDSIRLESLIIPSSVTSIGSFTFSNTPKLTSIVFEPDSNLTILEDAVFSGATGLKTLTIPKSVISIKKNAFTDTPNLTTILFAADSELTTIENRAFYEAQGLERIIIPKQVIQIGNEAFYGNNHLHEVHFASGSHLEIIGHAVFYGTNITELNIPNHVITISNGAFMGMSHLEKMTLPFVGESHYATGKTGNFGYLFGQTAYPGSYATPEYHQDSKVLFGNFQIPNTLKEVTINGDTPIAQAAFYGVNSIETMTLPFIGRDINATGTDAQLNYLFGDLSYYAELETVILTGGSKIAEHAFSRMRVEHVVIPRSVTTIEAYAFHNSALETIRFEPLSQLTHIGDYAFSGLSTLKSIHIPRNVVTLGNSAFRGSGLESITFEAGSQLTTIEDYAFQDATNLTTIEIPNRVTSIGQSAFWRANNLTTINIMPGSQLEIIGESAFRGLQQIEHIVIPSSVTTIEDYAFYDVTNVQTLTFEAGSQLTTIGDYAFSGLNRVEELVLPAQLTMIGAHAFSNWYQLKTLNLPRQLESIGESAFSNLEQITHLLIPNNLDTIGNYAFLNATNLKTIVFEDASEVTTIGYAAFGGASQLESITIPYVGRTRISQGPNAQFGYLFGQDEYENSYRTIMYINDGIIYPEFYIPNTLKEVIITDITTIPSHAFAAVSSLERVVIPKMVQTIESSAFNRNTSLKWVEFEEGSELTTIGNRAFSETSSLSELILPDGLISIGDGAFENAGLSSITIPVGVIEINPYTFHQAIKLESIVIKSPLVSIGSYAFAGASRLTSLKIPKTVVSIGGSAFSDATGLISVEFEAGSQLREIGNTAFQNTINLSYLKLPQQVSSIQYNTFQSSGLSIIDVNSHNEYYQSRDGVLFNKDMTRLIAYPSQKQDLTYTIPHTVETIGLNAFFNNQYLTTINFASGSIIKTIEPSAFFGVTGITSLNIPATISKIGSHAFSGMSNLENVTFESGSQLKVIAGSVFQDTSKLTSIQIPLMVSKIENSAFNNSGIHSVLFAENGYLREIESHAFRNTVNLTTIYIPKGVSQIGRYAFAGSRLLNIEVNEGNNTYRSLDGILYSKDLTTLVSYPPARTDTSYVLPSFVESIEEGAFSGAKHLEKMTLPFIGASAIATNQAARFGYLFGTIPYEGSYYTTNGYIPDDLKEITLTSGTTISIRSFEGVKSLEVIHLPSNLVSIEAYAFWRTGLQSIEISAGVTTIGDYSFANTNLKQVILPQGLLSIGSYAFSSTDIEWVVLPQGLQSIGANAFNGTYHLESIVIPNSVVEIGSSAFYNSGLKTILFEENSQLEIIERYLFSNSQLTTIEIPRSVTVISSNAFSNSNIKSVTFEGGSQLTRIESQAFFQAHHLESIVIPKTVTRIGEMAFSHTSSLTEVQFEENSQLTTIEAYAFAWATALVKIEIPNRVESIGPRIFANATSLESISIPFVGASAMATGSEAVLGYLFMPRGYGSVDAEANYQVKSITWGSYYVPKSLQEVIITGGTTIGKSAFDDFSSLTTIILPNGLISIGPDAFRLTTNLQSLVIPTTVTAIDQYTFTNLGHTELSFFTELSSKPAGWPPSYIVNNWSIYWQGEWYYNEQGVPTPNERGMYFEK